MRSDIAPTAKLLNDSPASKDAFGSHERLASALAAILAEEPGSKAIALEGGWGSGKSTVVNLLRKALCANPHHSLLVFDAWAHEGDPLRRTFLESLIEHLTNEGWIDRKKWAKKRQELAKRRRVTDVKTVPKLTTPGRLIAFATFLVPLGFALLNSGLRDGASLVPFQTSEVAWKLLVGLVMTIAPLLVLGGHLLVLRFKRDSSDEDAALSWGLLIKGKLEDTRTETIETPNPTSVEFEAIFTDLLHEALADDERRFVLVFDNLDRVSSKDALAIWGTLGTFLDLTRKSSLSWPKRLWVVVPYDPDSIKRLWNEGGAESSGEEADGEAHRESNLKRPARAPSFLDKAFQLRLAVPPLVLSNWHDYLLGLLREALPDHEEPNFHSVYRLFALRAADGTPPTPRDLKLYVNSICGVYRQWGNTVPLPDAAYYVLLVRDGLSSAEIGRRLRAGDLPERNVQSLLSKSIADNLTVLLFNVEAPKASQLLLEEKLTAVLQKPDPKALKEMSEAPGFWPVLETLDFQQLAKKEGDKIANAGRCLHESGVVGQDRSPMCETTIKNLRMAAEAVESWSPFGVDIGTGLVSLCSLAPEPAFASRLLGTLTAVDGGSKSETEKRTALQWFDATLVFVRGMSELALASVLEGGVRIPGDAATTIAVLDALHTKDPKRESWGSYSLEVAGEELVTTLATAATESSLSEADFRAICVIQELKAVGDWAPLIDAARAHLGGTAALPAIQIHILLRILWELRNTEDQADTCLSEIATTGHLMHHLHPLVGESSSRDAIDARAWSVFIQLRYASDMTAVPSVGNSPHGVKYLTSLTTDPETDTKTVARLSALFYQQGGVEQLFDLARKEENNKPLLVACVTAAQSDERVTGLVPAPTLIKNWDVLRDQKIFDGVIEAAAKDTDIQAQVMSADFERDDAGLYAALIRTGQATDGFKAWCITGLKTIDLKGWNQELRDEQDAADLIADLVDNDVAFELGQEYQDAIVEHAKAVVAGKAKPSYLAEHWGKLLVPLKGNRRKMVQRRLYDAIAQATGKIAAPFFGLYGEELMDVETLSLDDKAVANIFTGLLTQKNVRGLQWLHGFLSRHPDYLDNHPAEETVSDFRERIARVLATIDEEDETFKEAVTVLAADLKIEPKEDEEQEAEDDEEAEQQ